MDRPLEETVDLLLEKYRAVWALTRQGALAAAEDAEAVAALVAERQKLLDEVRGLKLPKFDPGILPKPVRIKVRKVRRLGRMIRRLDQSMEERIRRRLAMIQEELKWRGFVQAQALASYTRQIAALAPR